MVLRFRGDLDFRGLTDLPGVVFTVNSWHGPPNTHKEEERLGC